MSADERFWLPLSPALSPRDACGARGNGANGTTTQRRLRRALGRPRSRTNYWASSSNQYVLLGLAVFRCVIMPSENSAPARNLSANLPCFEEPANGLFQGLLRRTVPVIAAEGRPSLRLSPRAVLAGREGADGTSGRRSAEWRSEEWDLGRCGRIEPDSPDFHSPDIAGSGWKAKNIQHRSAEGEGRRKQTADWR